MLSYAEKIKKLREKLLISQSDLAEMLGVSFVTVNRWENEKFEPSLKIKRKLKVLFDENSIKGDESDGK